MIEHVYRRALPGAPREPRARGHRRRPHRARRDRVRRRGRHDQRHASDRHRSAGGSRRRARLRHRRQRAGRRAAGHAGDDRAGHGAAGRRRHRRDEFSADAAHQPRRVPRSQRREGRRRSARRRAVFLPRADSARPRRRAAGRPAGVGLATHRHVRLPAHVSGHLTPRLPPTPLEQGERLEQLRALEHGYRIIVPETAHRSVGVDTPSDLAEVEAMVAAAAGISHKGHPIR